MKNISLLFSFLLFTAIPAYAQSDECATATLLTANTTCVSTAGTTVGASESLPPVSCNALTSTAAEDVWYQFVATSTTHRIIINGGGTFDPVVYAYDACGANIIDCADATFGGQTERLSLTGLTISNTYYIRVYGYSTTAGGGEGTFTICVISPPINDECPGAIQLTDVANSANGTTIQATQTTLGCTGNADDDIWYYFITTSTANTTVTVTPAGTNSIANVVFEIMSGSCPAGTSVICRNATTGANPETFTFTPAAPNTTYYVRVYSNADTNGSRGEFTITVTPAAVLPLNLASFIGQVQGKINVLNWKTLSENNVQFHVVERSIDGVRWSEVGRVNAKGESQVSVTYSLQDNAPLARAYYRLRSVDFDGKENVSSSIVLTRKSDNFGITSVYPSPTTDKATVQFNSTTEEKVTISVMDMTGRLVMQQVTEAVKDINELPIQLTGLQAGVYSVTVSNSTGVSAPVRFVKQ